ncbi:MAG TPA: hypothetical protein VMZ26_08855 [Pyrinomonadaceae bacterium]|nr:hypothetical protein [Pyrinomonadaceae bacterium]
MKTVPARYNSFLQAEDETGAELALEVLLQDQIDPEVRRFFRAKLRVSLVSTDDTSVNQDALDLISEVKTLMIPRLRALRDAELETSIENLQAYVKTVSGNVFNRYLRRKYPLRGSLKNQLRYLLTHHDDFALWKSETDLWACGRAPWRSLAIEPRMVRVSDDVNELVAGSMKKKVGAGKGGLMVLVAAVFDHFQRPILFEDLVTVTCELKGIKEPAELNGLWNGDETAGGYADPESELEQKELVKCLWQALERLPTRHRAALLLNLKGENRDNLLALLPLLQVASVRQIAASLGFEAEKFARVWNELPWDDLRIAGHLGLTRQQVINLRQSARTRLKRLLG